MKNISSTSSKINNYNYQYANGSCLTSLYNYSSNFLNIYIRLFNIDEDAEDLFNCEVI